VLKTAFRVFGDQASRSDLNHWGIHPVAGLGSQFRGLHQVSLETRLDHSAIHPESGTVGCDGKPLDLLLDSEVFLHCENQPLDDPVWR